MKHASTARSYASMWSVTKLGPFSTRFMKQLRRRSNLLRQLKPIAAHPEWLQPSVIESIANGLRRKEFFKAAANGKAIDADSRWSQLTIPVVALYGDRDVLVPTKDAEHFLHAGPHVRSTTLRDCGHFAHIERPDAIAKLLFGS